MIHNNLPFPRQVIINALQPNTHTQRASLQLKTVMKGHKGAAVQANKIAPLSNLWSYWDGTFLAVSLCVAVLRLILFYQLQSWHDIACFRPTCSSKRWRIISTSVSQVSFPDFSTFSSEWTIKWQKKNKSSSRFLFFPSSRFCFKHSRGSDWLMCTRSPADVPRRGAPNPACAT